MRFCHSLNSEANLASLLPICLYPQRKKLIKFLGKWHYRKEHLNTVNKYNRSKVTIHRRRCSDNVWLCTSPTSIIFRQIRVSHLVPDRRRRRRNNNKDPRPEIPPQSLSFSTRWLINSRSRTNTLRLQSVTLFLHLPPKRAQIIYRF